MCPSADPSHDPSGSCERHTGLSARSTGFFAIRLEQRGPGTVRNSRRGDKKRPVFRFSNGVAQGRPSLVRGQSSTGDEKLMIRQDGRILTHANVTPVLWVLLDLGGTASHQNQLERSTASQPSAASKAAMPFDKDSDTPQLLNAVTPG